MSGRSVGTMFGNNDLNFPLWDCTLSVDDDICFNIACLISRQYYINNFVDTNIFAGI